MQACSIWKVRNEMPGPGPECGYATAEMIAGRVSTCILELSWSFKLWHIFTWPEWLGNGKLALPRGVQSLAFYSGTTSVPSSTSEVRNTYHKINTILVLFPFKWDVCFP